MELFMADDRQLTISADFLPKSEGVRMAIAALYLALPKADMQDIIRRFHQLQGLFYLSSPVTELKVQSFLILSELSFR